MSSYAHVGQNAKVGLKNRANSGLRNARYLIDRKWIEFSRRTKREKRRLLTSYDPARKLTLTSWSKRDDSSGALGLYLLTLHEIIQLLMQ